jgi:hypothetical protein
VPYYECAYVTRNYVLVNKDVSYSQGFFKQTAVCPSKRFAKRVPMDNSFTLGAFFRMVFPDIPY